MKMQTGCRLIKDKEGGLLLFLIDVIGEFHTLVLTTGEG